MGYNMVIITLFRKLTTGWFVPQSTEETNYYVIIFDNSYTITVPGLGQDQVRFLVEIISHIAHGFFCQDYYERLEQIEHSIN